MATNYERSTEPRHSREDLQRILYELVAFYLDAKRHLGGDSEFLANRMEIAKQMLEENHWWPSGDAIAGNDG